MQGIQVLARAVKILELIAETPETPHGLGEVAAAVGLSAPTCARILSTLVGESYVEQMGYKKGYILGPMSYALASRGPYRKDLVTCSDEAVRELASATGETALVAILHQRRRFILVRAEGGQDVQVRPSAVALQDVYPTATGRLLLAHMDAAARESFVAACGRPGADEWPEAVTTAGMESYLAGIRKAGIEVNVRGEQVVGIGLPLRQGDAVVAALGLYLPTHRYRGEHRTVVVEGMRRAAGVIESRLAALDARGRAPA